jgi:hypothetical protein
MPMTKPRGGEAENPPPQDEFYGDLLRLAGVGQNRLNWTMEAVDEVVK